MDRIEEIRQITEAAKAQKEKGDSITAACIAWSIVANDIPYLLSEVDRLQAALSESQRREKAAVEDIYLLEACDVCTHYDSQNNMCTRPLEPSGTCFEWRGPRDEKE